MVGLHSSRLSGLTSSFRRRERSFERDKTATKFSNHCFVLLQFLTWNYLLDKENRPQTAISFLKILENKKKTTNSFMSLHARASRANVYLVLNLFASCACLQKYSIQHYQLYAQYKPTQPHRNHTLISAIHPRTFQPRIWIHHGLVFPKQHTSRTDQVTRTPTISNSKQARLLHHIITAPAVKTRFERAFSRVC